MGLPVNSQLPLLDQALRIRDCSEVIDRTLALDAVVAVASGLARHSAKAWLEDAHLTDKITPSESAFLHSDESFLSGLRRFLMLPVKPSNEVCAKFQRQVECLQALAWLLKLTDHIALDEFCQANLVQLLPDVGVVGSAVGFRTGRSLRAEDEVIRQCDLAYCVHWGLRNLDMKNKRLPKRLAPYVVIERRRVFEWVLSPGCAWDEVSLDT